jgi:phospholipid/cholesterol/gamma-HCH transport system substrate-binding protein
MTRGGLEVRVGLTVVIAAAILVIGTMWFQRFQLTDARWSFFVRFDEIGGLVSGDPIMVNGVERGRVEGVSLLPNQVVVEMAVTEGVELPRDSRIDLKSIGIMGERFVAITQGTSPRRLAPGDTTGGNFLMGMSEVMGSAGTILDEVAQTSRNLKEILEMLNEDGRLRETMGNLADASARMRDIADHNEPRLANAIDRFENVATMMDSLVSSHYASVDSSLESFGRSGRRMESAVSNLEAVSGDLREITTALKDGEGTMGRLLTDEDLAVKLENAIAGLDSLVADIKRHPGRYVTFSLF